MFYELSLELESKQESCQPVLIFLTFYVICVIVGSAVDRALFFWVKYNVLLEIVSHIYSALERCKFDIGAVSLSPDHFNAVPLFFVLDK